MIELFPDCHHPSLSGLDIPDRPLERLLNTLDVFQIFRSSDESSRERTEQNPERSAENPDGHTDERAFGRLVRRCQLNGILEREGTVVFTLDDDELFEPDESFGVILFQLAERLIRDGLLWKRERDDMVRLFFLLSHMGTFFDRTR